MNCPRVSSLLFAVLCALSTSGLGAPTTAQERSDRIYAQRAEGASSPRLYGHPGSRASVGISTSRYRGPSVRSHLRYGSRGYGSRGLSRVWLPGRYERVAYTVRVPARTERVWVPAVHATRYRACGTPYSVLVSAGHWKEVCYPARNETRYRRCWVPGRYEYRTARGWRSL